MIWYIYKLCNTTGYTYNLRIYLGNGRQNTPQMMMTTTMMTATQVTIKESQWEKRTGRSQILHEQFLPFSRHTWWHTKAINCSEAVKQNHKAMPEGFDNKTLELKWCNILGWKMSWQQWFGKTSVTYILMNIHKQPAEGNFLW